jgi:hypothetical protein
MRGTWIGIGEGLRPGLMRASNQSVGCAPTLPKVESLREVVYRFYSTAKSTDLASASFR